MKPKYEKGQRVRYQGCDIVGTVTNSTEWGVIVRWDTNCGNPTVCPHQYFHLADDRDEKRSAYLVKKVAR